MIELRFGSARYRGLWPSSERLGSPPDRRTEEPQPDPPAIGTTRGCRTKALLSGWLKKIGGMGQNFLACDREQPFLLPPDVREWLPENHLAWFVIDAVGVMDTSPFYAAYREDGHGRAAYEPSMMVGLLLYCWARGVRSSRAIERACVEDVACRVIAAHQRPDHATVARFVVRHERALGELFGEVLALCADAGLATVGVIAIDGTKVCANASRDRSVGYEQLARRIVEEAIAVDAAETAVLGELRGDELPEIVARRQGREGWLRAARQRLDQQR
jgi:transposase